MTTERNPESELLWSDIEKEDVEQEYAILAWKFRGTDKVPSRKLIYWRMKSKAREYLYWDEVPVGSSYINPVDEELTPSVEVIEALVAWASKQELRIRDKVLEFLDNPSDSDLHHLLTLLRQAGLLAADFSPQGEPKAPRSIGSRKGTLVQLVLKALELPTTKADLYNMARQLVHSRRPEAALRQTLRRLLEEKLIIETDTDVYVKVGAQ